MMKKKNKKMMQLLGRDVQTQMHCNLKMVLAGVDFWYDNYGLWSWQAKPSQAQAN